MKAARAKALAEVRAGALAEARAGALAENEDYLRRQLITYIGNKRALLDFIGTALRRVQKKLRRKKLTLFDVFSGSGIAARYFKQFADLLLVNDLEKYSAVINRCYLSNRDETDLDRLRDYHRGITERLSRGPLEKGIVSEYYAPAGGRIRRHDRVFYTPRNAMYIDTARRLIGELPEEARHFFIAPLLSEASIHANTSGVFKGFYKNRETGIGQFGGNNRDALSRITGDITLPFPVFSNFHTDLIVYNGDANRIIDAAPEADLAYLDPPYNQHPYGSNYFMLNLILDYRPPQNPSRVSGIPDNWNRSEYNREKNALGALRDLVERIRAKYLLISFNSEGFIGLDEMRAMLEKQGRVEVLETRYNCFRGSRNLRNRNIHVREYLYLLEK
ncbi:MAG: DNA adenine methylase [Treponema sp.]|jgi:adenine-specific DNA-methyltransferase|nr:DNA adenine methylase [Treponema sp.]